MTEGVFSCSNKGKFDDGDEIYTISFIVRIRKIQKASSLIAWLVVDTPKIRSLWVNVVVVVYYQLHQDVIAALPCLMTRGQGQPMWLGAKDRMEEQPQSALEFGHSHCPNGRLGQDLGLGGFAFALKLPELLNTNLPTVRAKLGQTSSFPNGPQISFPIGQWIWEPNWGRWA